MNDEQILKTYSLIEKYHNSHLKQHGVKLPKLKQGGKYTKDALTLVFLAQNYPDTQVVSKTALTEFIKQYYPDVNDVQQARHLAAQKGWYILSGTRKDNNSLGINAGEYKLVSLEEFYPGFTHQRRELQEGEDFFEALKAQYDYRCATCGSKEGEPHRYWKNTTTVLQMGHMDPQKPLKEGNIIPQCEKCNRPDRNYWIYDAKGRVVGIGNEKVVDTCTPEMQKKIFERLKTILNK